MKNKREDSFGSVTIFKKHTRPNPWNPETKDEKFCTNYNSVPPKLMPSWKFYSIKVSI